MIVLFHHEGGCTQNSRLPTMELATATDAEPEIVTIILSYLNLRELHNAASVCHLWRSSVPGAYLEWQNAAHWERAWSSGVGLQVVTELCTELCAMRTTDSLPEVVMTDAQCSLLMRMLVAAMRSGTALVEAAKVEPRWSRCRAEVSPRSSLVEPRSKGRGDTQQGSSRGAHRAKHLDEPKWKMQAQ